MKVPGRGLLLVAAGCSGFVAVLHVSIAIAGPAWYRYFGAPSLAARIEAGEPLVPTLLALAVAAVFELRACYALSGAGTIRHLPLLRTALFVIAGVYLLRGVQVVPEVAGAIRGALPGRYPVFSAFSAFSAFAGVVYLLGVIRIGRKGDTQGT